MWRPAGDGEDGGFGDDNIHRLKPTPPGLWLVPVEAPAIPSPGQRGASSEKPIAVKGTQSWDDGVSGALPLLALLALLTVPLLLLLVLPLPPLPLPPKDHRPLLLLLLSVL